MKLPRSFSLNYECSSILVASVGLPSKNFRVNGCTLLNQTSRKKQRQHAGRAERHSLTDKGVHSTEDSSNSGVREHMLDRRVRCRCKRTRLRSVQPWELKLKAELNLHFNILSLCFLPLYYHWRRLRGFAGGRLLLLESVEIWL